MDQARQASLEEVQPGDESRVFYKLTVPRKVIVMLGGPTMNLLIATVLFGAILTLYGLPEVTPSCPVSASASTSSRPARPAPRRAPPTSRRPRERGRAQAGRHAAVDRGHQGLDVGRRAQGHPGNLDKTMTIVYERDGQSRTVVAKPLALDLPVYDDQGQPTTNDAGKVVTERAGFLGTTPHRRSGRSPSPRSPVSSGSRSPARQVWC